MEVRLRAASLISKARRELGMSLRDLAKEVSLRYETVALSHATLHNWEEKGISTEAVRLLLVLRLLEIPVSSVVDSGKEDYAYLVKEQIADMTFGELCKQLLEIRPASRRTAITMALVQFLQTLAKTIVAADSTGGSDVRSARP